MMWGLTLLACILSFVLGVYVMYQYLQPELKRVLDGWYGAINVARHLLNQSNEWERVAMEYKRTAISALSTIEEYNARNETQLVIPSTPTGDELLRQLGWMVSDEGYR